MDSQQLAEAGIWLDQYAAASANLQQGSATAVSTIFSQVDDWYDEALIALAAAEAVRTSADAREAAAGLAEQYVAAIVGLFRGGLLNVQRTTLSAPRNGADMTAVYTRPADVYRRTVSFGGSESEALDKALRRAQRLIQSDAQLADRESAAAQMEAVGVQHYRRVVRPELSETGTCGLCIAASTKVYKIQDLLPMHGECKCKTMPIEDGVDPGARINGVDLAQLYEDAGSTKAEELRRTRYQVNQHGEFGPVLTNADEHFRGPKQVAHPPNPAERARKELTALLPVLKILETRAAAGEDVNGPLTYQRDRISMLRRVAA